MRLLLVGMLTGLLLLVGCGSEMDKWAEEKCNDKNYPKDFARGAVDALDASRDGREGFVGQDDLTEPRHFPRRYVIGAKLPENHLGQREVVNLWFSFNYQCRVVQNGVVHLGWD